MSTLPRRVWPLKLIGLHARTAVLGSALRSCAPSEAEGLGRELLNIARKRPDSLAVPHLVSRWSLLSAPQRGELGLIIGTDWPELAAYMAADADPVTRAGVARACGEIGGPGVLAGASIVSLLADPDESVAEEAERTLGVFMRALADRTLDDKGQAAARSAADGAIETFDTHRRTGALRTAIQHGLVSRGAPGAGGRWMNDADHPAHMVVRGLIRTSNDPAMRSCAWVWLKHPSLATACAQRLTRADGLADQSVVLERSHLALNPLRPAGLTGSSRVSERDFASGGALPRLSQIDGLSLAARRGLARWLGVVPVGDRLRDAASAVLLTDEDALVRQSLVVAAAASARPPACLLDLIFDGDGTVASTAADAVLSRTRGEALPADQRERLTAVLSRSGVQALRHLAAQLSQQPGGEARDRAVADAVRLTEKFAGEGADAVSPRAVASAVTTLAASDRVDGRPVEPLLLRAAELPDARVRANAVEGLLRRARTRPAEPAGTQLSDADSAIVEVFLDRATDPHHRIRANAARGLLVCGWRSGVEGEDPRARGTRATLAAAGSRTLAALLADSRTMHRVAGLWLAHRLGDAVVRSGFDGKEHGSDLLDRVTHAAGRAIDPMERLWAQRARERLEAGLRERWSKRAPALEEAAA
jgi:hypothetical protein